MRRRSLVHGALGAVPGEREGVDRAEAQAWADEQRGLGERGEFYFACMQFCFTGTA